MNKRSLIFCCLLFCTTVYAQDKLDMLDMQSQEFFKAITGLEKEYFDTQVVNRTTKSQVNIGTPTQPNTQVRGIESPEFVSKDDYARNVFNSENEVARIKTDFAKISAFTNLKMTSMYNFNGQNYVVFELSNTTSSIQGVNNESTFNMDGRYKKGDVLLGHKIIDVNTRTKKVELYKEIDDEYGYSVYLSNHGASVSDLKKNNKKEQNTKVSTSNQTENKPVVGTLKKPDNITSNENTQTQENDSLIKGAFSSVQIKEKSTDIMDKNNTNNSESLYTVNASSLNVRDTNNVNGTILRLLRENDKFSIIKTDENWALIHTVYKFQSGDIMDLSKDGNWVYLTDANVSVEPNNKGE